MNFPVVYVVIVTYNNRWHFLKQCIDSLRKCPNLHIVIVNNGSDKVENSYLDTAGFLSFTYRFSDTNRGSAWGFSEGMRYVISTDPNSLILLLDDDNTVGVDCIRNLIYSHEKFRKNTPIDSLIIMSWRTSRKYLSDILDGYPVEKYQYTSNEFLGFSLSRMVFKLLRLYKKTAPVEFANLKYAPYGGLFFSADYIKKYGLPLEEYFVYADDFEFTSRCTRSGGKIILVRNVKVEDVEESWQVNKTFGINTNLLYGSKFRVYYSVRNFLIFQQNTWVSNKFIFICNGVLFSFLFLMMSLFYGKFGNIGTYFKAIVDGLNKRFIQLR